MRVSTRSTTMLVLLALLATACGGTRVGTVDPLGQGSEEDLLSSCEPAGGGETATLVEPSGQHPPVTTMEEAVTENPDAEFRVEELEADGHSREEALHAMYAQVVGQQLFAAAQQLPGYVTGAYARPLQDEPFHLSFSGAVPEELDPDDHDLDSFGLDVTTGAAGLDREAMTAAVDAVDEAGMRLVSASGDEIAGTAHIEVLDATPEQVAAWEHSVDEPSRWCLVRAPRTVPCDGTVVAEARQRAARQGEVLPNEQDDNEPPTPERAEEVRRSHLGLTVEASREKAAEEERRVRVVVQDGVELGANSDLDPGRLSLTVCDGIVADARMDLEPDG